MRLLKVLTIELLRQYIMRYGLAQKAVRLGVQQWTEGSEGLRGRKGLVRVKTKEWQKDR